LNRPNRAPVSNLAPRYGGPPKACFEMARSTAKLGHAVSIYTTNQDGPTELNVPTDSSVYRDGVEIRYFPIQHPRFWGFSLPLAIQLRSAVKVHECEPARADEELMKEL
jgi:hypothetical protein